MREKWRQGVAERARAYWTAERLQKLTGGKRLIVLPTDAAPLLRALGLMQGNGAISADAARKYHQINHLVALLEPAFRELAERFAPVRVLDAGCGSSYLTFLLSWAFAEIWKRPVEILGVDRDAGVIEKSRERYALTGLPPRVVFEAAALEAFDFAGSWKRHFAAASSGPLRPNAVVALHACDTATDDVLALAIALEADFIAAAPCCHAELARKWADSPASAEGAPLSPIRRSPHLRRETAASITDALRMLLLRACGYEVAAMEFVPSAHTPKNTLLRAHRRGHDAREAAREYAALKQAIGGHAIRLEERIPAAVRERLALRVP